MESGRAFITHSAELLQRDLFPQVRVAVQELTDEQIWWRPNDASNSAGNLLLHLTGNISQWIVGGVGNTHVVRDRPAEFAQRSLIPGNLLLEQLGSMVGSACGIIRSIDPATLNDELCIQGNDVTVLQAVYHVVEHFSMHTGQILMLAKMIRAQDLKLYDFPEGAARRRWISPE